MRGERVQFSARVAGKTLAADWTVSGTGCTEAACGTISTAGLYSAPMIVPKPPLVLVKATLPPESIAALPFDLNHESYASATICSCDPKPKIGQTCWAACVFPSPSK